MKTKHWLALIFSLALFARIFGITKSPPSLNWDEASIGYNAYSVLKTGKDEWGRTLPLSFKAFGEHKLPAMIYASIPSIAIFGLNDFAVRLTPALLGVFAVYLMYKLAHSISSKKTGLIAAFLLAISPWHLHLSRAAFEASLAFIFIQLGLLFFFYYLKNKKPYPIYLSSLFFSLSIYSYNSAKIAAPLIALTFAALFFRKLFTPQKKKHTILAALLALALLSPTISRSLTNNSELLRFRLVAFFTQPGYIYQIEQARNSLSNPFLAKILHNRVTWISKDLFLNVTKHFTPRFLLTQGGAHTQRSLPQHGLLYFSAPIFLLFGFLNLKNTHKKFLLPLLFIFSLPSAITINAPSTLRSYNLLLPLLLVQALGINHLLKLSRKKILSHTILILMFLTFFLNFFLKEIYAYPKKYAEDWQYSYKQAASYIEKNPEKTVYFTTKKGEPYIFTLFYLNYPPQRYQNIEIDRSQDPTGWYHVHEFDRFKFVDFNKTKYQISKLIKQDDIIIVAHPDDVGDQKLKKPDQIIKNPQQQDSFLIWEN